MHFLAILILPERHAEQAKHHTGLIVRLSSSYDCDFHTADLIDLFIVDFREQGLFFQTEGIVAAAVKGVRGNTAEVTNTGQNDVDEPLQPKSFRTV